MSRRGRRRYGGDEADADGFTRGFDMVFNVPGASGDSELEGHNQWINVLAWSWGLSRGDNDRKKPARILNAIAAKKKEIVNQAMQAIKQKKQAEAAKKRAIKTTPPDNADGNGQVEKKIEETLNKQINGSGDNVQHESGAQATAAVADDSGDDIEPLNEHEIAEEALADYDSDNDDDNQFDESEVKPRSRTKPNMQNLSLTKYVDIASPLLMLKCLSKEPAFDCTLRICKRREVKKPKSESDAKSELADVKEKSDKKHALADGDSSDGDAKTDDTKEEEKKEFESVVVQELLLQDCYIGSVSTGGSGGEDRLTENITINFSRVVFSYTDHLGFAPRGARGEIPTKTVYYDSLRHKAMALDQAVANAIEEQRKLAPVSTVLLDYLNLRSKPNTATQ